MNSRQFARKWLERNGLFRKESDYEGWLGEKVMETWEYIANQGHSGSSAALLFEILGRIHVAYASEDHPIWQEFWDSPEGQALKAQYEGKVEGQEETPL
jgi:hypothetical protein